MVICLERGANDLHMVQLMPLSPGHLCFGKIQNGLSFCYRLTWLLPDKGPQNGVVVILNPLMHIVHITTQTTLYIHDDLSTYNNNHKKWV